MIYGYVPKKTNLKKENTMKEFTKESTISYTAGAPISFSSAPSLTNPHPFLVKGDIVGKNNNNNTKSESIQTYSDRYSDCYDSPQVDSKDVEDNYELNSTTKYDISLKQLDLGCILTIGDKQIAFSSPEEATIEINNLINNREATINKYNILFSNNK